MKNLLLPVLLWTLAFSHAFAQKTLQSQIANAPQQVQQILRKAVYQSKNATVQFRSAVLQLDSTKTFVNYIFSPAVDSTPSLRSRFEYPSNGQTVETDDQFVNGMWQPVSRTTTTSDALGRVTNGLAETYDSLGGNWVWESNFQIFPHGATADLVDSIHIFAWDNDQFIWVSIFNLTNTYGPQNRLLKSETTIDFGGQAALLVENYSYDANQDNTLIEKFLEVGGFPLPTGKQELTYNNHLVIQTIDYSTDGVAFVPSERVTYAYNSAGKVKQENTYEWAPDVNDWNPTQTVTFDYDAANRLIIQETVVMQIGQVDEKEKLTYTYVQDENIALASTFIWDAGLNTYVLDKREYYYYSGNSSAVKPTPQAVKTLVLSPNPTTDAVQLFIEKEAKIQVIDAAGRLMQSLILQPGETLNLAGLPNGIYQITAQSGSAFYAGKLVKQ